MNLLDEFFLRAFGGRMTRPVRIRSAGELRKLRSPDEHARRIATAETKRARRRARNLAYLTGGA